MLRPALALVLLTTLPLRLWGVEQGLPCSYSTDEATHFGASGDRFLRPRLQPPLLPQPVWLTYLAGARLFGRVVGLVAAATFGFAFLPIFYGHLALNDVPTLAPVTLAPVTLALYGIAGVVRRARLRDYVIAGIGVGLASATRYTGGGIGYYRWTFTWGLGWVPALAALGGVRGTYVSSG
ncbi:MAG: ArnT family glycosyltransferase [Solirubrobacteraceae bacterium]